MSTQPIFAGIAGGKKYYYGDDGELYDEAGIKQPKQYADILKKNFTQPNPQSANPQRAKKVKPPPLPSDDDDYDDEDDDLPRKPTKKAPGVIRTLAKSIGEDALRSAFPEVYGLMKRYRKVYNKDRVTSTAKSAGDKKTRKESKDRKKADKKRNDRELSLKIDTMASDIRSHGELLRQQITLQERSLEFLNKISQGVKAKDDDKDTDPKLPGGKGRIKRLLRGRLLPLLGLGAVLGAGAGAVYLNSGDHAEAKDTPPPSKADDIMPDYSGLDDAKTFSPPPEDHTTEATDEAKERRPSGGGDITIKADNLTFESRIIKLDARVITINSASSSSSGLAGGRAGGPGDTADATNPFKHDGTTTVPDGGNSPFETTPGGAAVGGYPRPFRKGGGGGNTSTSISPTEPRGTDAAGGGGGGGGGTFTPDTVTPSFEGIPGGKGATSFGGTPPATSGQTQGEPIARPHVGPDPTKFTGRAEPLSRDAIKEGENNPRLAESRGALYDALDKDPATKELLHKGMLAEGGREGLQANLEQVSNYAQARNMSIKEALHSGFFGPINQGKAQQRQLTDADREHFDAALGKVRAGSNKIDYRIDQGMPGDPNYAKEQDPQYRPTRIDGSFFADHPEVGVGWAAKQKQADVKWNEEQAAKRAQQPAKPSNNLTGGQVTPEMSSLFNKDSLSKMKPFTKTGRDALSPEEYQHGDFGPQSKSRPEGGVIGGGTASADPGVKGLSYSTNRIGMRQGNVIEPGAASASIKPIETLKETPGEIPDHGENDYNSPSSTSSVDEPAEKSSGNKTKVTENSRNPKSIRKIDLGKYYPQYPKSDYGDQTGISVV